MSDLSPFPADVQDARASLLLMLFGGQKVLFSSRDAILLDVAPPQQPKLSPQEETRQMHMPLPLQPEGLQASKICRDLTEYFQALSPALRKSVLESLLVPVKGRPQQPPPYFSAFFKSGSQFGPAGLWLLSAYIEEGVSISADALSFIDIGRLVLSSIPPPLQSEASRILLHLLTENIKTWSDAQWSRDGHQLSPLIATSSHFNFRTAHAWCPEMEKLATHLSGQRSLLPAAVQKMLPGPVLSVWIPWRLKHKEKATWSSWSQTDTFIENQRRALPDVLRSSFKTDEINPMPEKVRSQVEAGLTAWMADSSPVAEQMLSAPKGNCEYASLLIMLGAPLDIWMLCLSRSDWPDSAKAKAWPTACELLSKGKLSRTRDNLNKPETSLELWVRQSPPGVLVSEAPTLVRVLQSFLLESFPVRAAGRCGSPDPTEAVDTFVYHQHLVKMAQWAKKEPELSTLWHTLSPRKIADLSFILEVTQNDISSSLPRHAPKPQTYRQTIDLFDGTSKRLRGTFAFAASLLGWPTPWPKPPKMVIPLDKQVRQKLSEHHKDNLAHWDAAVTETVLKRVTDKKNTDATPKSAKKSLKM